MNNRAPLRSHKMQPIKTIDWSCNLRDRLIINQQLPLGTNKDGCI